MEGVVLFVEELFRSGQLFFRHPVKRQAIMKDYYEVLEVHPKASGDIIKKAYQTLARRYHPDLSTLSEAESTRRMSELNEAYRVLSDPAKRQAYDEACRQAEVRRQQPAPGAGYPPQDQAWTGSRHARHSARPDSGFTWLDRRGKALLALIVLLAGLLIWFFVLSSPDDDQVRYQSIERKNTPASSGSQPAKQTAPAAKEPRTDELEPAPRQDSAGDSGYHSPSAKDDASSSEAKSGSKSGHEDGTITKVRNKDTTNLRNDTES